MRRLIRAVDRALDRAIDRILADPEVANAVEVWLIRICLAIVAGYFAAALWYRYS